MLRIQTKLSTPPASAPLNEASFTDRSQPRARHFGGLAAVCLDADPSPYRGCTHLEDGPDDDGLIIPKYGLMFLLKHTVGGKRLDLGAIAGELNGPRGACFVRQVFVGGGGFTATLPHGISAGTVTLRFRSVACGFVHSSAGRPVTMRTYAC